MEDPTPAIPSDEQRGYDAAIDRAADWLRAGRVVAFPTETVYGLGASALDERAVALVYALKGRPANNPLIVHVSGIEMARGLCHAWPEAATKLAERFWPGPLTLVLAGVGAIVPANVAGGGGTIAIRVPRHPVALALIDHFGGPLVGPSANRSGMVSPTTANHVAQAFGDDERVMILDGGPCDAGIESTVVALTETPARVLRRGVIGADEIAAALGAEVAAPEPDETPSVGDPHEVLLSPGLLSRHYAPSTPAALVEAGGPTERWASRAGGAGRVAIMGSGDGVADARAALGDRIVFAEAMPVSANDYAHALYAALRRADESRGELILIEEPPSDGELWRAIHDRLRRATTPES